MMSLIPGNSVIREFESRIAEHCQSEFALSVCNATTGILGVFYALGLAGTEIITTPLTWPGALSGPLALNCRLRFCDVEPDTLTIDPGKLEQVISRSTTAVFTADLMGYPARLDEIKSICDRHGIWLIHDAATSFGSAYKSFYSGYYADVTVLSFGAKKLFTTGEGGCILTHQDDLYYTLVTALTHSERQDIELGFSNPFSLNTKINPLAAEYGLQTFERQVSIINRHKDRAHEWIQDHGLEMLDDVFEPNYYRVLVPHKFWLHAERTIGVGLEELPFRDIIYRELRLHNECNASSEMCTIAEVALVENRVVNLRRLTSLDLANSG